MLLSVLLLLLLLLPPPGTRCSAEPRTRSEPQGGRRGARAPRRGHHVGNHRELQHKEKFLMQLTGPLSFDPKCKKQFHRLYHGTRDCTVPAYYRRCARLLSQLARSPRCVDR